MEFSTKNKRMQIKRHGRLRATASRIKNLYILDNLSKSSKLEETVLYAIQLEIILRARVSPLDNKLWHKRLGHYRLYREEQTHRIVRGLKELKPYKEFCDICVRAKATKRYRKA